MGSDETPLRLPVINFSILNLKPGTPEWDLLRADVRIALEEYGCFEASFNKIPMELRKAILGALEELFDLPLETKMRNVSEQQFRGYIGQYPTVPLYESLGIDDADIAEKVDAFTQKLWPEGNESFSKTVQSFSEQLSELDATVRKMVMESFGLEKYMDEHLSSTSYIMRVMKYKGPGIKETEVGLKAHTDKSIVTILYQNHVDGLEVQTTDGSWIKVKLSEDSFVVMIGDSFHALLNGRLNSPYHRVMMTGKDARYSLGLFSYPKDGYIISAPEELVDEEHPRLFKPCDHLQLLKADKRDRSALKAYEGV